MAAEAKCPLLALLLLLPAVAIAGDAALNITNACGYTVWPAVSSRGGSAPLSMGFQLMSGQWRLVAVPFGWTGQVWARTLCSTDSITGKFTCMTGDCGTGCEDCAGGGAATTTPVTLAQFHMNGIGGRDSYDVTLENGFNVAMLVCPRRGAPDPPAAGGDDGDCAPAGCVADLNAACPHDLRVTSDAAGGAVVACMSACQAFGSDDYCCTAGDRAKPTACTLSVYSEAFKQLCPFAVAYPYDVATSIFSCGGGGAVTAITYTITFCPMTSNSGYYTPPAPANHQEPPITATSTGDSQAVDAARIALIVGVLSLITAALGVVAKCLGVFERCCR